MFTTIKIIARAILVTIYIMGTVHFILFPLVLEGWRRSTNGWQASRRAAGVADHG